MKGKIIIFISVICLLAMCAVCVYSEKAGANKKVNVVDLGAKGDGKFDNTQIFQKALNKAKEDGEVRITVPEGIYLIKEPLSYFPNTYIEMTNETEIICAMDTCFMSNIDLVEMAEDYSLGALSIRGGRISSAEGMDSNIGLVGIQAGKLSTLILQDIKFVDMAYNNHVLDISGCANVLVERCEFRGMVIPKEKRAVTPNGDKEHNALTDMIQIDVGRGLGVGKDNEFSETASVNVRFKKCIFKKNEANQESVIYRPIDIHSTPTTDASYQNIIIEDCEFYDCLGRAIGIGKAENVVISGNYFESDEIVTDNVINLCVFNNLGIEGSIYNVVVRQNKVRYSRTTDYNFLGIENAGKSQYKVYNILVLDNEIGGMSINLDGAKNYEYK